MKQNDLLRAMRHDGRPIPLKDRRVIRTILANRGYLRRRTTIKKWSQAFYHLYRAGVIEPDERWTGAHCRRAADPPVFV